MIDIVGYILANPLSWLGIAGIIAGMYFVLYKLKYKNDPYFPFKKHDKLMGLFMTVLPGRSPVIDFVDNNIKIGEAGMYVPKLDKLYASEVSIIPGNPSLVSFTKGIDGGYYPDMMTYVTVDNLTDVEEVAKQKYGLSDKEAKKVKAGFLTKIVPTINTYRAMMNSHIRALVSLIVDNQTKEERNGLKALVESPYVLMIIFAMISLGSVYLVVSASIDALTKAYNNLATLEERIVMQKDILIQWCSDSVEKGKVQPFPDLFPNKEKNEGNKTINKDNNGNLLNILGAVVVGG